MLVLGSIVVRILSGLLVMGLCLAGSACGGARAPQSETDAGADELPAWVDLDVTESLGSCALSNRGKVRCWGKLTDAEYPPEFPVPEGIRLQQLSHSGFETCGVTFEGALWCAQIDDVPAGDDFVEVRVSGFAACARRTGDVVVCFGRDSVAPEILDPPSNRYKKLSIAARTAVGLTEQGGMEAWGFRAEERFDVPEGTFTDVVASQGMLCGIEADSKRANCVGAIEPGVAIPDVSLSRLFETRSWGICAETADDRSVLCWGNYLDESPFGRNRWLFEIASDVPADERFTTVSVDREHACGITDDGRIECWGRPSDPAQTTPPMLEDGVW